jgi:hypothetical protein
MKTLALCLAILSAIGLVSIAYAQQPFLENPNPLQPGEIRLGITHDEIRRGHDQSINIFIGKHPDPTASSPIPIDVTVRDTQGQTIPVVVGPNPFLPDLPILYSEFTIPGNAMPGNFTVTASAPYDPEYKSVTETFRVTAPS